MTGARKSQTTQHFGSITAMTANTKISYSLKKFLDPGDFRSLNALPLCKNKHRVNILFLEQLMKSVNKQWWACGRQQHAGDDERASERQRNNYDQIMTFSLGKYDMTSHPSATSVTSHYTEHTSQQDDISAILRQV